MMNSSDTYTCWKCARRIAQWNFSEHLRLDHGLSSESEISRFWLLSKCMTSLDNEEEDTKPLDATSRSKKEEAHKGSGKPAGTKHEPGKPAGSKKVLGKPAGSKDEPGKPAGSKPHAGVLNEQRGVDGFAERRFSNEERAAGDVNSSSARDQLRGNGGKVASSSSKGQLEASIGIAPAKASRGFESWILGRCTFKCKVCLERFSSSQGLGEHVGTVHGWANCDLGKLALSCLEERVLMKCKLCDEEILSETREMEGHVGKGHRIEMRAYYDYFVKDEVIEVEDDTENHVEVLEEMDDKNVEVIEILDSDLSSDEEGTMQAVSKAEEITKEDDVSRKRTISESKLDHPGEVSNAGDDPNADRPLILDASLSKRLKTADILNTQRDTFEEITKDGHPGEDPNAGKCSNADRPSILHSSISKRLKTAELLKTPSKKGFATTPLGVIYGCPVCKAVSEGFSSFKSHLENSHGMSFLQITRKHGDCRVTRSGIGKGGNEMLESVKGHLENNDKKYAEVGNEVNRDNIETYVIPDDCDDENDIRKGTGTSNAISNNEYPINGAGLSKEGGEGVYHVKEKVQQRKETNAEAKKNQTEETVANGNTMQDQNVAQESDEGTKADEKDKSQFEDNVEEEKGKCPAQEDTEEHASKTACLVCLKPIPSDLLNNHLKIHRVSLEDYQSTCVRKCKVVIVPIRIQGMKERKRKRRRKQKQDQKNGVIKDKLIYSQVKANATEETQEINNPETENGKGEKAEDKTVEGEKDQAEKQKPKSFEEKEKIEHGHSNRSQAFVNKAGGSQGESNVGNKPRESDFKDVQNEQRTGAEPEMIGGDGDQTSEAEDKAKKKATEKLIRSKSRTSKCNKGKKKARRSTGANGKYSSPQPKKAGKDQESAGKSEEETFETQNVPRDFFKPVDLAEIEEMAKKMVEESSKTAMEETPLIPMSSFAIQTLKAREQQEKGRFSMVFLEAPPVEDPLSVVPKGDCAVDFYINYGGLDKPPSVEREVDAAHEPAESLVEGAEMQKQGSVTNEVSSIRAESLSIRTVKIGIQTADVNQNVTGDTNVNVDDGNLVDEVSKDSDQANEAIKEHTEATDKVKLKDVPAEDQGIDMVDVQDTFVNDEDYLKAIDEEFVEAPNGGRQLDNEIIVPDDMEKEPPKKSKYKQECGTCQEQFQELQPLLEHSWETHQVRLNPDLSHQRTKCKLCLSMVHCDMSGSIVQGDMSGLLKAHHGKYHKEMKYKDFRRMYVRRVKRAWDGEEDLKVHCDLEDMPRFEASLGSGGVKEKSSTATGEKGVKPVEASKQLLMEKATIKAVKNQGEASLHGQGLNEERHTEGSGTGTGETAVKPIETSKQSLLEKVVAGQGEAKVPKDKVVKGNIKVMVAKEVNDGGSKVEAERAVDHNYKSVTSESNFSMKAKQGNYTEKASGEVKESYQDWKNSGRLHQCRICSKEILMKGNNLEEHLAKHKALPEKYFKSQQSCKEPQQSYSELQQKDKESQQYSNTPQLNNNDPQPGSTREAKLVRVWPQNFETKGHGFDSGPREKPDQKECDEDKNKSVPSFHAWLSCGRSHACRICKGSFRLNPRECERHLTGHKVIVEKYYNAYIRDGIDAIKVMMRGGK